MLYSTLRKTIVLCHSAITLLSSNSGWLVNRGLRSFCEHNKGFGKFEGAVVGQSFVGRKTRYDTGIIH